MASGAIRAIKVEELALAQKKALVQLRIFVGGPYLDRTKPDVPLAAENGGATLLRHEICKMLEDKFEHTVTTGEDVKLLNIYQNHLEDLYEASTFEFMHVKEHCDAVIIIPSSPGSFCELGYFSADDEICRKMLVLRSKEFVLKPGYLHYGPSVQAKNSHATIEDVDYIDTISVFDVVERFVKKLVIDKMRNKARIR